MNRLENSVCIVSGAANGLGAAMAAGLVAAGARAVLADRDADGLDRTEAEIRRNAGEGRVATMITDVTDEAQVQKLVDLAIQRFGGIDVLINNAGTGPHLVRPNYLTVPLRSWEVPVDKWRRIIDINAIGPFILSRAVLPHLVQRGWGRIVNLSTTWETMLRPGFASYGVSKAAVEAMTVSMARELEGSGVTVNTVHPGGPVDTAQVPADIGVERAKLLRPQVMVPVITWLASRASDGITARRFTAARWDESRPAAENLRNAGEPAAWPQLVTKIVMAERGNLSDSCSTAPRADEGTPEPRTPR
jgi:3-oxoacyl-[acyl-carrier protein] reductase